MVEYYDSVRVSDARKIDEVGQAIGPDLRGLPRVFVEERPELAWMLDSEIAEPVGGDHEGEMVWVTLTVWEENVPHR